MENARGARESLSSEMWENLNTMHAELRQRARSCTTGSARHEFFLWVKSRAAACHGIVDTTMSRDNGWRFFVLGRSLERVDMTTRLLSARYGDAFGRTGWTTTLRSCSAYEAYLRTYKHAVDASSAVEFLLLDRLFPRSVYHALTTAEHRLGELDPTSARAGVDNEARRRVGRLRAELEFISVDEALDDLPRFITRFQRECGEIHGAIARRYFRETPRHRVEPLTCRGDYASGTRPTTSTRAWCTPRTTRRVSPSRHVEPVHARAPGRSEPARQHLPVPRLLGDARPHVRHPPRALTARRHRQLGRRDGRAPAQPRRVASAWDAIDSPGLTDRFFEYLTPTSFTRPDEAVLGLAAELRAESEPAAALFWLGTWLREHIEYEPGSTSVSTTASEVVRSGRGVCQDFAHLGLAVLRAAGIPARYASGYLYPEAAGGVGDTNQGQSHAWLEAWAGDWHPLDPTTGADVAERHVLVAHGRDYSDVAPLKGVYHGGPSRNLSRHRRADPGGLSPGPSGPAPKAQ